MIRREIFNQLRQVAPGMNHFVQGLGILLPLLWCSCATESHPPVAIASPNPPADVRINPDAGRGNLLFVTPRLESGEELSFLLDTGSTFTSFDKSLASKLGKPVGETSLSSWGATRKAVGYAAPKLYLGDTPLMMGSRVYIGDYRQLSAQACRPVMGILGMDCLRHYCLQLDFAAGKIRFLDAGQLDDRDLGDAYRLRLQGGCPFIHQDNLAGAQGTNLFVDTGYRGDGTLESSLFKQEARRQQPAGTGLSGQRAGHVWFSQCTWNGGVYTNLLLGDGGTNFLKGQGVNSIGLRFLARHLVTFDFPRQIMYFKQTHSGPLEDERMKAAEEFLSHLKAKGELPGWSTDEAGITYLEPYPNFEAFDSRKNGETRVYHYQVAQDSGGGGWKLQKAWQTDQDGKIIEEFRVL
ncbi:MAG TPA: retropepsin-like aspartic protease [Candidatus Acidoferrales bacterium]|nr:retropepsin-like aspartic protease [Candidatus Acidoferrales bacterium]